MSLIVKQIPDRKDEAAWWDLVEQLSAPKRTFYPKVNLDDWMTELHLAERAEGKSAQDGWPHKILTACPMFCEDYAGVVFIYRDEDGKVGWRSSVYVNRDPYLAHMLGVQKDPVMDKVREHEKVARKRARMKEFPNFDFAIASQLGIVVRPWGDPEPSEGEIALEALREEYRIQDAEAVKNHKRTLPLRVPWAEFRKQHGLIAMRQSFAERDGSVRVRFGARFWATESDPASGKIGFAEITGRPFQDGWVIERCPEQWVTLDKVHPRLLKASASARPKAAKQAEAPRRLRALP